MDYSLKELLDIPRLQDLLDSLDEIHSFPSAIIDSEGTILTATAWQDICTKFHRVNPKTKKLCIESDAHICTELSKKTPHVLYRCPMGLVDTATPIIIEGKHLGNIFTGQLFIAPPDKVYFIEQARQYGFDENAYLAAMRKVPIFTEEQLHKNLTFISKLAQTLTEQGLQNMRLREASEALRKSELRHRSILHTAIDGIWFSDIQGNLLEVNSAYCRMSGYSEQELLTMSISDLEVNETEKETTARIQRIITHGVERFTSQHRRKDGKIIDVEVSVQYRPDHGGQCVAFLQDVTESKQAQETLKESENRLRDLMESIPAITYRFSVKHGGLFYSPQVEEVFGYPLQSFYDDPLLWKNSIHPDDVVNVENAINKIAANVEHGFNIEYRVSNRTGEWIWLRDSLIQRQVTNGDLVIFGIAQDVSKVRQAEIERLSLEAQFQQTQKLESLGVLAGGIAHDFNNILTIILGHCYIVDQEIDCDTDHKVHIKQIEKAAHRAADLCHQLLSYGGKNALTRTRVNLWLMVDENVKMLFSAIKKNVSFELDLGYAVPEINGDSAQIQQIVMNLIINASEAIGEKNGSIKIVLRKIQIAEDPPEIDLFGNVIIPGSYAYLEVTDNGCGMSTDTQKRIFEPFFTTKYTGRGLGMSAVLGIIKSHDGYLQLSSASNIGTTIKVYFPPLDKTNSFKTVQTAVPVNSSKMSGTILLVDDEDSVLKIGTTLLKFLGFSVLTASNGSEALEIFHEHGKEINLIMLDVVMPVMGGIKAYHSLRTLNKTIPIIICSGYSAEEAADFIDTDEYAGFVHKPYKPQELRAEVLRMIQLTDVTVHPELNALTEFV